MKKIYKVIIIVLIAMLSIGTIISINNFIQEKEIDKALDNRHYPNLEEYYPHEKLDEAFIELTNKLEDEEFVNKFFNSNVINNNDFDKRQVSILGGFLKLNDYNLNANDFSTLDEFTTNSNESVSILDLDEKGLPVLTYYEGLNTDQITPVICFTYESSNYRYDLYFAMNKNYEWVYIDLIEIKSEKKFSPDYWTKTIEAIENWDAVVDKEKWNTGVQLKEYAKDPNHRNLTVRYYDSEYPDEQTLFAFQNGENEYLLYRYEKNFEEHINMHYTSAYHHKVEIRSTDSEFKKYEIIYTLDEYRNEVYFDTKKMEGKLEIFSDGTIHYDLVPYLASAIDLMNKMLDEFEKDFLIEYDDYSFVHLPKLMDDLFIPSKIEIDKEELSTHNYYSEDRINAKGYRLITFAKFSKDYSTIQFGEYCVEQGAFSFKYDVQLKPRTIENSYDLLLTGDPDEQYAIYIKDNVAYLYLQSVTDDYILEDVVNHDAKNAKRILYEGEKNF